MNINTQSIRKDQKVYLFVTFAVLTLIAMLLVFSRTFGDVAGGRSPGNMLFQTQSNSPQIIEEVRVERISLIRFEEAQQRVSFRIPLPAWLPEGLTLRGAHVQPPDWAQIFYSSADSPTAGNGAGLGIEITKGSPQGKYVFPDTAKQQVMVHGQAAICVHGAWNERQEWMDTAGAGALEWAAKGFTYDNGYSGLDLTCNDLGPIAEALR